MTPDAYATLAIYSKHPQTDAVTAMLEIEPTRVGEKRGIFSWLFSTAEINRSNRIEDHAEEILNVFGSRVEQLKELGSAGSEIRLWVYFGLSEPNQAFVLSPALVEFLSSLGADICVDVWSRNLTSGPHG